MRKMIPTAALVAIAGLAAPATAMMPSPITMWFSGDAATVAAKFEAMCADLNLQVVDRSDRSLRCARPAAVAEKMAVQTAGNGYSGSASMNLFIKWRADRGAMRVDTLQSVAVEQRSPAYSDHPPLYSLRDPKARQAMTELLEGMGGQRTRPSA